MSDTAMLMTILIIFILLGAVLPSINAAFGQDATDLDTAGIEFATGQGFSSDDVGVDIIISISTMFFWTFGSVPVLLDLIVLTPLRITFFVLLYRNIRGVGG